MAQVPIYNQQQVETSREGIQYQNVKADAGAFGVTGFDDLGRGLLDVNEALQKRQEENDKIAVIEAKNLADMHDNDILMDKDNGLYAKTGKDYLDNIQSSMEAIKKNNNDIIGKLKTNTQKQLAAQMFNDRYNEYHKTVSANAIKQQAVYKEQTLSNTLDVETQKAVFNRNNPIVIDKHLNTAMQAIDLLSPEKDPVLLKGLKDKVRSDIHLNILEAKLADGNLDAKDYFEKHKAEINSLEHPKYLSAIKENSIKGISQQVADKILASGLSFTGQLKEIQKIKDPDIRDAVQVRVEHGNALQESIKRDEYDNKLENYWKSYESNPNPNNIPVWVEHNDKMGMLSYTKAVAEAGKPEDIKTNLVLYGALHQEYVDNPQEFSKINLNQYLGGLSPSDYKHFVNLQKTQKTDPVKYTQLSNADKRISVIADDLGFGKADKEGRNKLFVIAQNLVTEYEKQTGKKLTLDKESSLLSLLTAAGNHSRGWNSNDKTFDTLKKGMSEKANFIKDITNDLRYYEKVHGKMPEGKDFDSIVYRRANAAIQEKNKQVINKAYENSNNMQSVNKALNSKESIHLPDIPVLNKSKAKNSKNDPLGIL